MCNSERIHGERAALSPSGLKEPKTALRCTLQSHYERRIHESWWLTCVQCCCVIVFWCSSPPIYSFQISTNRRWAWFTNGLPGIEMIQLSSCGLHFHLIVQIGNCMLYTICWHVTEKVGRQNENPRNPETKEMNVDECIRGRLLWQTWTNVVNHTALCITTCCTPTVEEMAKVKA